MLFTYAVAARINGREKWQRVATASDAVAMAAYNANASPDVAHVERVRLYILPWWTRRETMDYPTTVATALATIDVDAEKYPTVRSVDRQRKYLERELRIRARQGQTTYLTPEQMTAYAVGA